MPANFPGSLNASDTFAFRAAVEAVIGVTVRGETPNRENVREWINTAVEPNVPTRDTMGRALYFADRMIGGPLRPNWGVG